MTGGRGAPSRKPQAEKPTIFRGTMRIMSQGNYVVGVANTIDYTVTDHDASGSYNLQYNTGRSR